MYYDNIYLLTFYHELCALRVYQRAARVQREVSQHHYSKIQKNIIFKISRGRTVYEEKKLIYIYEEVHDENSLLTSSMPYVSY